MKKLWKTCSTQEDVKKLLADRMCRNEKTSARIHSILQQDFSVEVVKENPKRRVLRLVFQDEKANLYLKLFAPAHFPFSLLPTCAEKEFRSAKALEKAALPVIDYIDCGKLDSGSFCISREVPSSVECRKYFFETVYGKPDLEKEFLSLLAQLIRSMKKAGIFHPDFHLGNILFSREKHSLFLPDPYGLTYAPARKDYAEKICHPLLELCNFLPQERILDALRNAGLATKKSKEKKLLNKGISAFRKRREKEYPKLKKRILGGRSKYAAKIELPEGKGTCFFRHTLWFSKPEKFTIDPAWHVMEYESIEEAEKIWVDSFLGVPLPPAEKRPEAWKILPSGKSRLYFRKIPANSARTTRTTRTTRTS
ncbi:MAG: hypothetical protein J6S58_02130, partial [Lentisphaeria bacterium]|nr:hypothetical protein [Lentisphaeria bacterium]